jgi:hypothetical protein
MVETISRNLHLKQTKSELVNKASDFKPEEDNSLNFQGIDTQYSTHCLHTYLAAMIPALAGKLIDSYVPPGGTVLDPFCGGGAVLVEAILSGRQALGHDINDLAILVSKAKTTYLSHEQIANAGNDILTKARNYSGQTISFNPSERVDYWFKPYMFRPLSALKTAIDTVSDPEIKNLMQVVFSATVRNVSLTYRNEIRLRRMTEKEQERFNPDIFRKFEEKLSEALSRVPELPKDSKAKIGKLDIRKLQLIEYKEIADAIVCSPPYGDERNGVPYTQFAKNMLFWLGYSADKIRESKDMSLGWGHQQRVIPNSRTLLEAIGKIEAYPDSVEEAINFYADYFEALKGMANAVKDRIVIVIGQRVLKDTIFDNGKITVDLMAEIGLPIERSFLRKLPSKRLPRMRNFGAAINRETILIFKK